MASKNRPKVLVTRGDHDPGALQRLTKVADVEIYDQPGEMPRSELLNRVKGKHGLLILPEDKMDAEIVEAAGDQLKVISTHSVGTEHVDKTLMKKKGILVGYTPEVLTDDVADLTVALALMTLRGIKEHMESIVKDTWKSADETPRNLTGRSLKHKTIGIFGFGRIGQATAKRLLAFNPGRIIFTTRGDKPEVDIDATMVSFEQLLKESDVIIITSSLNDSTRNIFNKTAFKSMKNSAFFINTSRGGLVNQEDLVQALKDGGIAGAGLDVMTPEPLSPDHELTRMKNVTLTPHIGSSTMETRLDMINLAVDNLIAGLEGRTLPAQL